jgi:hypothetical protein
MSELKLITPRRNFLIRALGFTAAGAVLPISIITADDAKARMDHHRVELEKAWRDYYGVSHNVRTVHQESPVGSVAEAEGYQPHYETSLFMVCAGGGTVVG